MADVLAAALLLEEAAYDLKAGDKRKALVARRYVRLRFGDRAAIGPESDAGHDHFDHIVGYAVIDA